MELTPLPEPPANLDGPVKAWSSPLVLPTYEPATADLNPMFLENRVFQGSSGRVYPLPFFDRISQDLVDRKWQAVHVENAFLRVTLLPELGGRVYAMVDKVNGYDVVYRNRVIKPALVGLAGPWLSGGIEFNWPQHHRPSTYMPVSWMIEEEPDGSRTVWMSENEPMTRMKGMHGVRLRPDCSVLELRVRLHNRTELAQTFLWWANVATEVNENYQSFFPEDVHFVADHAKRAVSAFPCCEGRYYGVDYAERARSGVPETECPSQFVPPPDRAPNDLRWYANIPVPTSYMCLGSRHDFSGGYDHGVKAGIVHIADHRISPGKKQWTWGNHDFGYAWDRNLTEPDEDGVYRPYIELMAGVFTDNQPDFSYLAPGETKVFSQYWYPIREIGPAVAATREAAIGLTASGHGARIGILVTKKRPDAEITVAASGRELVRRAVYLSPAAPYFLDVVLPDGVGSADLEIALRAGDDTVVERIPENAAPAPAPITASAPPPPESIESVDELWVTAQHLQQYRHATRFPEPYWQEALRRDPGDSRCNIALGMWHLRRAEFAAAEAFFRKAIARLTRRNPNPSDGDAFYYLGITLRYLGASDDAYAAFAKASWNAGFVAPASLAMAELDAARKRYSAALAHVEQSLKHDVDNLGARNLRAALCRRLGREAEARAAIEATLALDPLDPWALLLAGRPVDINEQTVIDVAIVNARAGFFEIAYGLVSDRAVRSGKSASPMLHYYAADYAHRLGDQDARLRHLTLAGDASSDYCFPSRIEDGLVLEAALDANPRDARTPYYLGNLLYDRRRHEEAITLWEKAAAIDPDFSIVWRNLGIGYFNVLSEPERASQAYEHALSAAPADARLLYERDQLLKRIGRPPAARLAELEANLELVARRDDLSLELSALYNQLGRYERAEAVIANRQFQPWEGGEGLVLDQWVRTKLLLGRKALDENRPQDAIASFDAALNPPHSLGEARHLLANQSDIRYWMGRAMEQIGDQAAARCHFTHAAESVGDFLGMEVRAFSEKTYFSAMSLVRLGRRQEAEALFRSLGEFAENLLSTPAKIDYFATSLPTMLIFEDDLQLRQKVTAYVMLAEAAIGLGNITEARDYLTQALSLDPNHPLAADLLDEIGAGQPA